MTQFITEDNNNCMGMVRTEIKARNLNSLLAPMAQGFAGHQAAKPENTGDPGVLFRNHGHEAHGEPEIFGFTLRSHQADHHTDQTPMNKGIDTDDTVQIYWRM